MKIAVFGIGGIGGLVGGALARKNEETYFIARGKTLEAIRSRGLQVESALLGDFTVRPKEAAESASGFGTMDAVIISCKGYSLKEACRIVSPMVGEDTLVVPLLNGVGVSDMMKPLLPQCLLADGVIHVFSHIEEPGHIVQSYGPCHVIIGMKGGERPQKLDELAEALNGAGIKTSVSEDILFECWRKYLIMCGNSVVFCYYDGPAWKVREHADYKDTVRAAANEIISVAAANGVKLPEGSADLCAENFMKLAPETVNSLYRDLSSGKPPQKTELDHLIGRMIEMGRAANIPTPYHEIAYKRFAAEKR